MNYLITVDIGTTSTKTLAFDLKGTIISKRNIHYPILTPEPDFSEQDPEEIHRAVTESIQSLVNELGKEVLGISFSSAMHSVIVMDSNDNALTNCIIWADNRSKKEADSLKKTEQGLEIYLRTGTPIHPMSPLCKIQWIRSNQEHIFHKAKKIISIKEYILFKLTGQYIIDHSVASATGLFDIYDLKWNAKALNYLGLSEDKLSKPVPVTHQVNLLKEQSDKYKIPPHVPLIIGASDGCLANLGANSIRSGEAAVTVGTSGAIRVSCNSPQADRKQRVFNYLLDEETFIVGGAINNGAITLSWFKDNFFEANTKTLSDEKLQKVIAEDVAAIKPGSDALIFLPYLLGERAPIWDANARGVFFGVDLKHTKVHFTRAIMEGVVFALYTVAKSLEELVGEIRIIHAGGGFAQSEVWVQMLADVFNKKVCLSNSIENSSLGAAVIGFKSLGVYKSLEDVDQLVEITKEFLPNYNNHLLYMKSFDIFEALYHNLKGSFEKLSEI